MMLFFMCPPFLKPRIIYKKKGVAETWQGNVKQCLNPVEAEEGSGEAHVLRAQLKCHQLNEVSEQKKTACVLHKQLLPSM